MTPSKLKKKPKTLGSLVIIIVSSFMVKSKVYLPEGYHGRLTHVCQFPVIKYAGTCTLVYDAKAISFCHKNPSCRRSNIISGRARKSCCNVPHPGGQMWG